MQPLDSRCALVEEPMGLALREGIWRDSKEKNQNHFQMLDLTAE